MIFITWCFPDCRCSHDFPPVLCHKHEPLLLGNVVELDRFDQVLGTTVEDPLDIGPIVLEPLLGVEPNKDQDDDGSWDRWGTGMEMERNNANAPVDLTFLFLTLD